MKTVLNQIRSWVATTRTKFVWLAVFSAVFLAALQMFAMEPTVITLSAGATGAEIQRALDTLPEEGGEVVLPAGVFEVSQPIVLQRNHLALRGSGVTTVLRLADGANCPVIIMGEPVNHPRRTVRDLCVSNLYIDGNRPHQQRELWRLRGEGSQIRNNGITVQNVNDSTIEQVTCARCRSGGLVTTRGVRRLKVGDLTSFDNQFDGLACYHTTDCTFSKLYLHNNPGAGISLDLSFNNNVISNAVLVANNLGIFMRASSHNHFYDISIRDSRRYGVFMAQGERRVERGSQSVPGSECVYNSFTNLIASNCGRAAFRVNNTTCTNNVIIGAEFHDDVQGGLSLARPDLVILQ
ncbi:MAG TPA: right-handed parallel beta-helix repeat-containing protein [Candidatus Saccharimonadales bacterium]|nr:right-handed parallel beta-helix repeat-containing protein [Candidatus Saccharimonadales bacterium]